METNAELSIDYTYKKHKPYIFKVNQKKFYKEIFFFNYFFLKYFYKLDSLKKFRNISYSNITYLSLFYFRGYNIQFSNFIFYKKDFIYFLSFYENIILTDEIIYKKFKYIHQIYKVLKKMNDSFIKYQLDNIDDDNITFIKFQVKRTDKEFFYFKTEGLTFDFKKRISCKEIETTFFNLPYVEKEKALNSIDKAYSCFSEVYILKYNKKKVFYKNRIVFKDKKETMKIIDNVLNNCIDKKHHIKIALLDVSKYNYGIGFYDNIKKRYTVSILEKTNKEYKDNEIIEKIKTYSVELFYINTEYDEFIRISS